jgi:thymidylate synthase
MNFALPANEAWHANLNYLLLKGEKHSPRGKGTLELLSHQSIVDMRYPVVTNSHRKMGYKFLLAEAVWILSGDNRVESIAPYAKHIADFSDDGYRFQGAYGPRVTEQLRYVIDTLIEDPPSRQAVISIWRESPRKSKDIPCTLTLQFLIRNGKINCVANMRSSDLWLGWVYDVFNFTMITMEVGIRVNQYLERTYPAMDLLELGTLYLNAGSQHLYDHNIDKARICLQDGQSWSYNPLTLSDYNNPMSLMKHLVALRDNRSLINTGFLSELDQNAT